MLGNLPLTSAVFGRAFTPAVLFAAGEQGVWYDPNDLSTMFQDTAGTTPVTTVGQSVALIRDKSGRGNHASQGTALSMPTLQRDTNGSYYLLFDGSNDGLATSPIDMTGCSSVSVFAGVRKLSDATYGMIAELSASAGANAGAFYLDGPEGAASNYGFYSRGTSAPASPSTATGFASPVTTVLAGLATIATASNIIRANGAQVGSSALSQGTGNYGNYPLYVGRRGGTTFPFNGWLYGLIVRGDVTNQTQVSLVENWLNNITKAF